MYVFTVPESEKYIWGKKKKIGIILTFVAEKCKGAFIGWSHSAKKILTAFLKYNLFFI